MSFEPILRARRSYELGRMRLAVLRGAVVAVLGACVALVAVGPKGLPWMGLSLVAVAFAEWRGGELAQGARRGWLAGIVTLLLPVSILRPCCAGMDTAMMNGSCCTMPSACGLSGIVVGLAVALVWPSAKSVKGHLVTGVGVALGASSLAAARCSGLYAGEAVGLALGLLAGVAASAAARAWMGRAVKA